MVSTNRSLVKYILLSIVTCGIYGLVFLHGISKDANVVCAGDGEETAGVIKMFLLSLVTCGIYGWVWYYKLGNRLANAGSKYGLNINENGTTLLLWMILGSAACGIGPFVAMHFIIKNMNALCEAYNRAN